MAKLFAPKLFGSGVSAADLNDGSLAVTYGKLKERVGHFLFGIRDATAYSSDQADDITEAIEDGLRRVYVSHNWSFFRPVKTITTADGTSTYSLPDGCESIESQMHYEPGESNYYPPVVWRHDSQVRKWQQDSDDTGRPLYFSVRTVEYDPTVGSLRKLVLWPTPDDEYVLRAQMTLRPVMVDSTDKYPIGAEMLSQVFIEACLAAAEHGFDERSGEHEKLFQHMLPLAIRADLNATAPKQLGPDAPKSDSTDLESRSILVGTITLDGTDM